MNSQAAELLFFNINVQKGNTAASSLRDEKWATWTQKLGFPVQGIFQGVDLTDVNAVCRNPTGKFVAVGYDDQTIRLFKYPCYIPKQVHKTFYGHSSHVTRIRFTPQYMVSTGGLDRTIIVWELERGDEDYKTSAQVPEDEDDALSDMDEDVDIPRKIMTNR
jgi:WD40 repeat protein